MIECQGAKTHNSEIARSNRTEDNFLLLDDFAYYGKTRLKT